MISDYDFEENFFKLNFSDKISEYCKLFRKIYGKLFDIDESKSNYDAFKKIVNTYEGIDINWIKENFDVEKDFLDWIEDNTSMALLFTLVSDDFSGLWGFTYDDDGKIVHVYDEFNVEDIFLMFMQDDDICPECGHVHPEAGISYCDDLQIDNLGIISIIEKLNKRYYRLEAEKCKIEFTVRELKRN